MLLSSECRASDRIFQCRHSIKQISWNRGERPSTGPSWRYRKAIRKSCSHTSIFECEPDSCRLSSIIHFSLSLLLIFSSVSVVAGEDLLTEARSLYEGSNWEGVLRVVPPSAIDPPDLQYYRGMSLARLERWQQAKQAFELGMMLVPRDKIIPTGTCRSLFQAGGLCARPSRVC